MYITSRLRNPEFIQLAAETVPGLRVAKNPKRVLEKNVPLMVANMVKHSEEITQMPLKLREQLADRSIRVISFSRADIAPMDEILLWSHYANMHEGVRIGFVFPKEIKYPFKLFEMKYRAKRFEIPFPQGLLNLDIGMFLVESAKVKSIAWEYEHEYRLLTHPACCEQTMMPDSKQECFLSFEREWVRSVDFGVRCPQSEIEKIMYLVKSTYARDVVCRRAVFHKSEYALAYENL